MLAWLTGALAFNAPTTRAFATFGNAQTKQLIRIWQPQPLDNVPNGDVLLPAAKRNMQTFVRARILLEDPSLGCIASSEDSLCLIICRFSKAEHQLLLPLWQPSSSTAGAAGHVFADLLKWHGECFGNVPDAPRLSGAHLESDQQAWADSTNQ